MRYLNPKSDLTFKLVFGEHPDLVMSFLNALLPLQPEETGKEDAWLRCLTEINEKTREVPEELLEAPEIKKAVTILEESAFTPQQLLGYEKFWDIISVEKTLMSSAERKGREKL